MSTKKSQNSIIALATLGVYLGLLMAGATPGILASPAAMTRHFDVRDELELEEKLDKNPDDERSPVKMSVQIYLEDVENFLSNLQRLKDSGKFDLRKDTFSVAQSTLLPCVNANIAGRYTPIRFVTTSESSRSALEYLSRGMAYGYSLGDCVPNDGFAISAADSKFNVDLDSKAFSIDVRVKKQDPRRALELIRSLESTIRLYHVNSTRVRERLIERTTFRADNDQVFVKTRLPRADLDLLLAKGAK